MTEVNDQFELRGVSHIALVCSDMGQTVDFYEGVLGMPLVKTMELPNGTGQHFFFDIGNGDMIAFLWTTNTPAAAPGVAFPETLRSMSAIGSMAHIAFKVPEERFVDYLAKLTAKGIEHDYIGHDLDGGLRFDPSVPPSDQTFAQSVYFKDPDGIVLEFCAWLEPAFSQMDGSLAPARLPVDASA